MIKAQSSGTNLRQTKASSCKVRIKHLYFKQIAYMMCPENVFALFVLKNE